MQEITHSSRKIADIIGSSTALPSRPISWRSMPPWKPPAPGTGPGFAVVASEVRNLAGRSAEAAKEIKALISASVDNVETGSQQVAEAGQSMTEIVASVQRVSDLIGEITASSTEQRDGIAQVNQAVTHLDQMTQQNAALVEESTAAAASMRDQAQHLADVIAVFNVVPCRPAHRPRRGVSPAPLCASGSEGGGVLGATAGGCPARTVQTCGGGPPKRRPHQPLPALPHATRAARWLPGGDDDWESF